MASESKFWTGVQQGDFTLGSWGKQELGRCREGLSEGCQTSAGRWWLGRESLRLPDGHPAQLALRGALEWGTTSPPPPTAPLWGPPCLNAAGGKLSTAPMGRPPLLVVLTEAGEESGPPALSHTQMRPWPGARWWWLRRGKPQQSYCKPVMQPPTVINLPARLPHPNQVERRRTLCVGGMILKL